MSETAVRTDIPEVCWLFGIKNNTKTYEFVQVTMGDEYPS